MGVDSATWTENPFVEICSLAAWCRPYVLAVKALVLQGLSAMQEFLSEYVQGRLSALGGADNNNSFW